MDDSALTLAERFRRACKARGVSMRSLEGDYPMIPRGYAGFIATGRRAKLSPEMIARISTLLGVSVRWLINGAGPMFIEDEQSRAGPYAGDNRTKGAEILRLEGEYTDDEIAAASDRAAAAAPVRVSRTVRAWRDAIEIEIRLSRRAAKPIDIRPRRSTRPPNGARS